MSKVVVIDNGAGNTRIGYSGRKPKVLPNQITKAKSDRRHYIGDQITECPNPSSLFYRRPFDKGYLVNWDLQTQIWNYAFKSEGIDVKHSDGLLLTEPLFNFPVLKHDMYQAVFEDHSFPSLCCASGPSLANLYYKHLLSNSEDVREKEYSNSIANIVVDIGYSFTHVVPFFDNQILNYAVKRINVGGKALTNYLKELVSYRHWNMMDETYVINSIKETVCYVSKDFNHELTLSHQKPSENPIQLMYVLPDFVKSYTGYVKGGPHDPDTQNPNTTDHENQTQIQTQTQTQKQEEKDTEKEKEKEKGKEKEKSQVVVEDQLLPMNNERFTVPELLFHPSDVGIPQAGVPEAIVQAVNATMIDLHEPLYANILLVGGSSLFPNFKQRLDSELRNLIPIEYNINTFLPPNADTLIWEAGSWFAQTPNFKTFSVTKKEYEEFGDNICKKKFLYSC